MSHYRIGFIGAGNMGGSLARAACKGVDPKQVLITDYNQAAAQDLAGQIGCDAAENNEQVVRQCKIVMLGVKPHILPGVLRQIAPVLAEELAKGEEKLLVSMAAGVTMASIQSYLGEASKVPLLRIMPNTPAAVGKGMMLIHTEHCPPALADEFEQVMSQSGRIDRIPESLSDAAATVSGCAPAFAYQFIEGLADGAVMAGVPRDKAMAYAAQALLGAAAMVLETGKHPGTLKDAVCSPGGSTIVGVAKLEEGGLRGACIQAVTGAYQKNIQLGKQ